MTITSIKKIKIKNKYLNQFLHIHLFFDFCHLRCNRVQILSKFVIFVF